MPEPFGLAKHRADVRRIVADVRAQIYEAAPTEEDRDILWSRIKEAMPTFFSRRQLSEAMTPEERNYGANI